MGVLLYHLLQSDFLVGNAGVDVFFVISGFVMGRFGSSETPTRFLLRRIIRIVPLYWSMTLLICALSLVPGLFVHFRFDANRLIQSLLFIPHLDPSGHRWPLLIPGWTLDYEMFFYIIFSLSLVIGRPIITAALVIFTIIFVGYYADFSNIILKTWSSPIIAEFASGMLISTVTWKKGFIGGVTLMVLAFTYFVIISPYGEDHLPRLILWGIPAFCLVSGAVLIDLAGRWPPMAWIENIGDASYSLYLTHTMVIAFVRKVLTSNIWLEVPLAITLSLLVALATWHGYEQPLSKTLSRFTRARTPS